MSSVKDLSTKIAVIVKFDIPTDDVEEHARKESIKVFYKCGILGHLKSFQNSLVPTQTII